MSALEEYNIEDWVAEADTIANKEFREAVHTILASIASDATLKANMILKGGILLAIRYQSHRFTKDIDFSTEKKLGEEVTLESLAEMLDSSMAIMVETLDYDLDCRVQSKRLQPKKADSTFPSIRLKIGYAYKGTKKHERLQALQSTSTISIDYSLNESTPNIDGFRLSENEDIQTYSLTDLMAEKYRSLLQQESRDRYRRQDIYDLNLIIEKFDCIDEVEKRKILDSLAIKSKARNIKPRSTLR